MDKKSKVILFSFFVIIAFVFGWSVYKFIILQDYYVITEISCEPEEGGCFIYECDSEEEEICPEVLEERISYYKLIKKKAYNMLICASDDEDCPEPVCLANEDCEITWCDSELEEEDMCSE